MACGCVSVVLADDHTLFRQGVRRLLETSPEVVVVAEAADGDEAVAAVRAHAPDVLLLDVEMPGPGAVAVLHALRRVAAATRVVMLTMHEHPSTRRTLLGEGAGGYLSKTAGREELIEAVLSGGAPDPADDGRAPAEPISPREMEVLRLLPHGITNYQIARRLGITEDTVKRHLTRIYRKLDAVSRIDAVGKATTLRLFDDDG